MEWTVRPLRPEDAGPLRALWARTPGLGLRALDDSPEGVARFLQRNPATCFGAFSRGRLVGSVLCGHDGRRGYIYHTAVDAELRGRGIGRALVRRAEEALRAEGIHKAALVAFASNREGNAFWERLGYGERKDLVYRNRSLNEENRALRLDRDPVPIPSEAPETPEAPEALAAEGSGMRVETERLLVRRFAWMDEADLCEYMLQRVHAYYEPHPDFTREKAGELLKSWVESDEMYAIELKEEAKVIGNLYLGRREFNTYELGYILHAGYQGRGYASEASRGAIERLFRQGAHRVVAECATGNAASWRLLERIGMQREGLLRQNVSFHKDAAGPSIGTPIFTPSSTRWRPNPARLHGPGAARGRVRPEAAPYPNARRFAAAHRAAGFFFGEGRPFQGGNGPLLQGTPAFPARQGPER